MEISKMLDKSFEQGKDFAFHAIKSHVITALDKADQAHSLTLPPIKPSESEKQSSEDEHSQIIATA